ncbi:MAG: hypothetical protein IJR63_02055 [Synergistaceae bacterium]|nr:hypothetical protein [Synergistaceae bacterium]
MTSQDNAQYVTIEMFNDGMSRIERRFDVIERRLDKVEQTMTEMRYEIRYNARDIDHLQTSVYWGFALLGIIVALAPSFRREKTEKPQPEVTRSDVQSMIDAAISRALGAKNQQQ